MRAFLDSILFPNVCLVCGNHTYADRSLCDYCIEHSFEPANPEASQSCPGHITPDYIDVQDALWKYDKDGNLQALLMKLKYSGRRDIGIQCGRLLGRKWRYSDWFVPGIKWKLVPVPLHWLKYWKRGYNQAELIAEGFSEVTQIPVCSRTTVVRTRYTRTQTGFNLLQRQKNIQGVFRVNNADEIRDHRIIIIDDVFTTGSTTYQLANTLQLTDINGVLIYTVGVA